MPINDRMVYQRGPWVETRDDDDEGSPWDMLFGNDGASTLVATSAAALVTLALAF